MEEIIWEGKRYLKGPPKKDWKERIGPAPRCALFYYDRNRCNDCYPHCGSHIAGCIRSIDFKTKLSTGGPEEDFVYWMIAEGCPQYHGG